MENNYAIKAFAYSTLCTEHHNTEPVLARNISLTPATLASQIADVVSYMVSETKVAVLREMVYNSDAGSHMQVIIEIDASKLICQATFPDMDKKVSFEEWDTNISEITSKLSNDLSLKLYRYILCSDKFKTININSAN